MGLLAGSNDQTGGKRAHAVTGTWSDESHKKDTGVGAMKVTLGWKRFLMLFASRKGVVFEERRERQRKDEGV